MRPQSTRERSTTHPQSHQYMHRYMKIKMVTKSVSISYWIGWIILQELYNNRWISLVTQHFSIISKLLIWLIGFAWWIKRVMLVVDPRESDIPLIITDYINSYAKYYAPNIIHNRLQEIYSIRINTPNSI